MEQNGSQINGGITMCVCAIAKCRCECKKYHICEKDYVWNPAICNCENGKYLGYIKYYG